MSRFAASLVLGFVVTLSSVHGWPEWGTATGSEDVLALKRGGDDDAPALKRGGDDDALALKRGGDDDVLALKRGGDDDFVA